MLYRSEVLSLRLRRIIGGIGVTIVIGSTELGPDLFAQFFYRSGLCILFVRKPSCLIDSLFELFRELYYLFTTLDHLIMILLVLFDPHFLKCFLKTLRLIVIFGRVASLWKKWIRDLGRAI